MNQPSFPESQASVNNNQRCSEVRLRKPASEFKGVSNHDESYSEIFNAVFGAAMRVVTLALFLAVFGAGAAHAQTGNEQVPFTATATAVITGVTKLPGGITQVNFNTPGGVSSLVSIWCLL